MYARAQMVLVFIFKEMNVKQPCEKVMFSTVIQRRETFLPLGLGKLSWVQVLF